jgi:hypothetical protein
MWICVEILMQNFDKENRKLDELLAQINSDTLKICNEIIANSKHHSVWTVNFASETKEQITKNNSCCNKFD